MKISIPQSVIAIYKILEKAHHDVYFVGGCVRNILLGKEVKDWDMTTSATPEEMLQLFPDGFYDNQFGTVGVPLSVDNKVVEITTFRSESEYRDKRHPEKV